MNTSKTTTPSFLVALTREEINFLILNNESFRDAVIDRITGQDVQEKPAVSQAQHVANCLILKHWGNKVAAIRSMYLWLKGQDVFDCSLEIAQEMIEQAFETNFSA